MGTGGDIDATLLGVSSTVCVCRTSSALSSTSASSGGSSFASEVVSMSVPVASVASLALGASSSSRTLRNHFCSSRSHWIFSSASERAPPDVNAARSSASIRSLSTIVVHSSASLPLFRGMLCLLLQRMFLHLGKLTPFCLTTSCVVVGL